MATNWTADSEQESAELRHRHSRSASEKGGRNGQHTEAHPESTAEDARLNNFMTARQRAVATRTAHRRLAWYHGADWRTTGYTGIRLKECIEALPPEVIGQMRRDLFGGFGIFTLRWSLSEIVFGACDIAPLYQVTFHRGTTHIERNGQPLADLVLETEEEWTAAGLTHNPTGTLDQAPPGALRILCVCTFGLETGVVLRHRTERILQRWGVDAWLEVAGRADAYDRSAFADVLLVTRGEEADARGWGHRQTVILEEYLEGSEIRRALAALPQVRARRIA